MWIKLRSVKHIERRGKMTTYHAGDWVDVGKQTALLWIAQGGAEVPDIKVGDFLNTKDTGVLIVDHHKVGAAILGDIGEAISVDYGDLKLPWTYTLIWNPKQMLRPELIPIGFNLLQVWQVACPLLPYEKLANTVGSREEQARTKEVIHDLRVPLYNPDMMFVKRCEDTQGLMDLWFEESVDSGSEHLALLRAIYKAKPLLLALPCSWTHPGAVPGDR